MKLILFDASSLRFLAFVECLKSDKHRVLAVLTHLCWVWL